MFVGLALYANHFIEQLRLHPFSVDAIFVGRGGIERFDVEILNVGAIVGEAPGDAIVVTDDDEGCARKREAFYVPARAL